MTNKNWELICLEIFTNNYIHTHAKYVLEIALLSLKSRQIVWMGGARLRLLTVWLHLALNGYQCASDAGVTKQTQTHTF